MDCCGSAGDAMKDGKLKEKEGEEHEKPREIDDGSEDKLETYANLAIDAYNQVKSKEYRLVNVVSSTRYFCQDYLYSITFEAKLPGRDDSDALTLVAEVYKDFSGECDVDIVCKPDERPPYDP